MITLPELKKRLNEIVIGQEEAVNNLSAAVYKYLLKMYGRDFGVWFDQASTVLMLGSTGVGKTYLIKQLANILDLYFIEINGKSIAQENWHGKSFVDLVQEQLHPGARAAIIFIDEFDKILTKNTCSGGDDVSYHIQTGLLKYIEGFNISKPHLKFDTKKCLFVFAGAFVGLDLDKEKQIGFNQSENKPPELCEALIKFGMIPEIAGRIQNISIMNDLTEKEYKTILNSEYFILHKYTQMLNKLGIFSTINQDELIEEATKKKLGARGLAQEVEKCITKIIIDNEKEMDLEKLNPLNTIKKGI